MRTEQPLPTPGRGDLVDEVVIVHADPATMMKLTAALAGMRYNVTAVDAIRAIDTAQSIARRQPLAMIVALEGNENVVEIRALMSGAPNTRFLFLAPQMPPRAPVARIINTHKAAIVARDEAPVVVISTLVALLSQHPREPL